MLKNRLHQILTHEPLENQRTLAKTLAAELEIGLLDLAAALIYLNCQNSKLDMPVAPQKSSYQITYDGKSPNIKMVRYRLSVGSQHHVTTEELIKVLVDESGVDKNNIENIIMQSLYTLVDLPDNMPQDIFLHLKSVTINDQQLDIKRVKSGHNKKRSKNRSRRGRQRNSKSSHSGLDHVNGG